MNAAAKERPGGKPGKRKKDELWSRIATLASKEKLSYLEATERCVKDYWKDHGLDKRP
ncbi:MAG: hypothetical protein IT514_07955 [Burkholderiales bacterium]|nr:hypothetical protein [Burkholderiales bacterium]